MPLLRIDGVSLAFGAAPLLDDVNFHVKKGQRICLLGRNGAGKSSFLKLMSQTITADNGSVWLRPEVRLGYLPQELPDKSEGSVSGYVSAGLGKAVDLLEQYNELAVIAETNAQMAQLETLQNQLDTHGGWDCQRRVDTVLQRLQLDGSADMASLSGGWRRRAALARALVSEPDILLMDEPTNHLDVPGIELLEEVITEFKGALVFITHDRTLLQKVANQIVELDRGQLFVWNGDYASYLADKEHRLEVEEEQNALFDKKLAREEVWIRQGIKARRTRNEGRVRALKKLREEYKSRRQQTGNARLIVDQDARSGKVVFELESVGLTLGGKNLFSDFSTRILKGDRVALIGGNGSGKTSFIRLLLEQLQADEGKLKVGTNLQVAYFDQTREQLDLEATILDNVSDGTDQVGPPGKQRHIISYLQDFLFSPERIRTPVKALSGGEVNRVLLAKLFTRGANVLVLDEPTNDLDMETLELLEEMLLDYAGTLILVSHDRSFVDNVVTGSIGFERDGVLREYVGGYADWIRQGGKFDRSMPVKKASAGSSAAKSDKAVEPKKRKLSYKDQRELDKLPEQIAKLEKKIETIEGQTAAADFYQQSHDKTQKVLDQLQQAQKDLDKAFTRWEELEDMANEVGG